MKKISALFVAVLLIAAGMILVPSNVPRAWAQLPGPVISLYSVGSDKCQNASVLKLSAPVAITTATTTNLVSAIAGDYIDVCKIFVSVVGTSPTLQFEYGTTVSTACDTGATVLSGAMAIPTTTLFQFPAVDSVNLHAPKSDQLCLVTGGTITGVEGFIVYYQGT